MTIPAHGRRPSHRCPGSSRRTRTPSSAHCGGAGPEATSGPGGTRCSPRPTGRRPTPSAQKYEQTYSELFGAGYTAVGEFHYLGLEEAFAALEAAHSAGIEIVLLLAAFERGGLDRFRQRSVAEYLGQVEALRGTGARVGLAPHSVRACSAAWLSEIGSYAEREGLVLHVHADEQPREIEECLAEHGLRPIELLARTGCLTPATTVVHATHASAAELDLLADAGAAVCLCPTTEANLGDGFPPLEGLLEREIRSPWDRTRTSGSTRSRSCASSRAPRGARLAGGRSSPCPGCSRSDRKTARPASGLDAWPDAAVDLTHPSLRGVAPEDVPAALVFSCSADVFRA